MRPTKLLINTTPLLGPLTGVGQYIHCLVNGIYDLGPEIDYRYYYGFFTRKLISGPRLKHFSRIKETIKKIPYVHKLVRGLKVKLAHVYQGKFDTYFEPNFIPLDFDARRVITTIHDFSFLLYPEWHPKERVDFFSKNFLKRIYRSDKIITPSDFIKAQAVDLLNIDPESIISIPHGYSRLFSSENRLPKPSRQYILFVGTMEPRKNLTGLIRAYARLPLRMKKEFKLRLVGAQGWQNSDILDLLERHKDHIEYMGYVNNQTLSELYRNAACFVYPSIYEGFGLPPLEAMASGCPAIVSNIESITEVCGDAVMYCDPRNDESLTNALETLLESGTLQNELISKGLKRSKLYSWEKSAQEHLSVLIND